MLPLWAKLGAMLVSTLLIASGQALLSLYVRGVPVPVRVGELLRYTLTTGSFYGFVVVYGAGVVLYGLLLRLYPLAEVTVTLMVMLVVANLAYSFVLGQPLTPVQVAGVVAIMGGLWLLHQGPVG